MTYPKSTCQRCSRQLHVEEEYFCRSCAAALPKCPGCLQEVIFPGHRFCLTCETNQLPSYPKPSTYVAPPAVPPHATCTKCGKITPHSGICMACGTQLYGQRMPPSIGQRVPRCFCDSNGTCMLCILKYRPSAMERLPSPTPPPQTSLPISVTANVSSITPVARASQKFMCHFTDCEKLFSISMLPIHILDEHNQKISRRGSDMRMPQIGVNLCEKCGYFNSKPEEYTWHKDKTGLGAEGIFRCPY